MKKKITDKLCPDCGAGAVTEDNVCQTCGRDIYTGWDEKKFKHLEPERCKK